MPSKLLAQAIKLHEKHMQDPKTTTPESQEELMELLYAHRDEMGSYDKSEGSMGNMNMMEMDSNTPMSMQGLMRAGR